MAFWPFTPHTCRTVLIELPPPPPTHLLSQLGLKVCACFGWKKKWRINQPFTEECSAQAEKYIFLKSFLDFSNLHSIFESLW